MDSENKAFFNGLGIGCLFGGLLALVVGLIVHASDLASAHDEWRRECVARGVAEYVVTGSDVKWQWKAQAAEQKEH